MGQPYIGEIRLFAGNFAPAGWAMCHGQLIPIADNDALFVLLGTTYGGDGQTTFALPDLRGRVPMHQGTRPAGGTFVVGERSGTEQETLTISQTPAHSHPMVATTNVAQDTSPSGKVLAQTSGGGLLYIQDVPDSSLNASAITPIGGSQPHENLQPYLCVNFIISLFGVFPPP